jgi:endonuclease YncB( thermonuclease family)
MAIRLNGAAAPEWDARGGFGAMDALRDLVLGKVVTCELDGEITYGQCAATCTIEGADVADTLVLHGLARDCPRDSSGRDQKTPRASKFFRWCAAELEAVLEQRMATLLRARLPLRIGCSADDRGRPFMHGLSNCFGSFTRTHVEAKIVDASRHRFV